MGALLLPNELVDYIVDAVDSSDLKSLRLTHSLFRVATERRLFATVFISKTRKDLANLLHIANEPYLAAIPTCLVWYELLEDQNDYTVNEPYPDLREQPGGAKEESRLRERLRRDVADLFWTVPVSREEDSDPNIQEIFSLDPKAYLARRSAAQHGTEQAIGEAVRKLTNLHTLTAQAMPLDWPLCSRGGSTDGDEDEGDEGYRYPFTASSLQVFRLNTTRPPNGLFLFGQECLGKALALQIRSLYLSGPFASPAFLCGQYNNANGIFRIDTETDRAVLSNIQTLDLCMYWYQYTIRELYSSSCLQINYWFSKVTKLQHVSICFERMPPYAYLETRQHFIGSALFSGDVYWPALQSLQLTDAVYDAGELVRFIKRHANTLRKLRLFNCKGHMNKIEPSERPFYAPNGNFYWKEHGRDGLYRGMRYGIEVSDKNIMAFINHRQSGSALNDTFRPFLSTGPYIWDARDCPDLAYFDAQLCIPGEEDDTDAESGYEADEEAECQFGYTVFPRTNSEFSDLEQCDDEIDRPYTCPWALCKPERSPMPYSARDQGRIAAWAAEVTKAGRTDLSQESVKCSDSCPELPEMLDHVGMLQAERKADLRQEERLQGKNKLRWCWARVKPENTTLGSAVDAAPNEGEHGRDEEENMAYRIYYWNTEMPGKGHPTKCWRFRQEYTDGTFSQAVGVDPLEYFSDWDSESDEDGDGIDRRWYDDVHLEKAGSCLPAYNAYMRLRVVSRRTEPTVYSSAFRRFLRDPADMGHAVEEGVDMHEWTPADELPGWLPSVT